LIAHSETVNAMLEQKVKSVRALERGLDVLLEIQSRRAVSLHELHQSLKLPKATLLRMLVTLASKGLVWQRLADGAYLPHVDAIALNRFDMAERIAEIASPHMDTLSSMVAWPSVLAVPRLDHVEIIETNSPKFRLDSATLGPVGLKLSYIHTATGRAYLAACDESERDAIIARLRPPAASDDSEASLRVILDQAASQGFSVREPVHDWPDRSKQMVLRDGRRSMGVAIMAQGQPVASINITWLAKHETDADVIARHLGALQATARAIGSALEHLAP
jgi:IclR family transcriptional regulator, mhp operon transcriptional activator